MMNIRQCICIMVTVSLLLLSCIETGWAEKVMDDDGNVITEAEIQANMGSIYRKGCAIGGGCLLALPLFIKFRNANKVVGIPFAIAFELAGISASYHMGKHFDHRRAISRIAQQRGWTEDLPVFDDDGNLITEAEVQANMGSTYRKGFAIGGGILLAVPTLIGGFALSYHIFGCDSCPECVDLVFPLSIRCERENEFLVLGLVSAIGFEVAAITASHYIGKIFDQQKAIEHIKAQRRKQKKHAFGEQEMTDGVRLQLLKFRF